VHYRFEKSNIRSHWRHQAHNVEAKSARKSLEFSYNDLGWRSIADTTGSLLES